MSGEIVQVFNNGEFGEVRTAIDGSGNPVFCARDVALALGYTNTSDAINKHCKGVAIRYPLETTGGTQQVRFITEPDLYRLIASSKLQGAQRFESWVFEEVLPAIRRHGVYATPATAEALMGDPDFMIRTFTALKEERERAGRERARADRLEGERARLLPRALAWDAAVEAKGTMTLTEAARYVAQVDPSMTRGRLLELLRADEMICKRGLAPTRRAIERGYMVQAMGGGPMAEDRPYARLTRKGCDWCLRRYCWESMRPPQLAGISCP